jgi:vancomycin resistance protein YoaR
LPKEPEQPITAKQVEAWLHTAQRKRLALHVQAMAPWNSLSRQQAFMEMSDLLQETLEEVRMISTTLREDSQALRTRTAAVRVNAAQLRCITRSRAVMRGPRSLSTR